MSDQDGITMENYVKMVQDLLQEINNSNPGEMETTIEFLNPSEEDFELLSGEIVNYDPTADLPAVEVEVEFLETEPELC